MAKRFSGDVRVTVSLIDGDIYAYSVKLPGVASAVGEVKLEPGYTDLHGVEEALDQAARKALDILERALSACPASADASSEPNASGLELDVEYVPGLVVEQTKIPEFIIEGGTLALEDAGWRIDPEVLEEIVRSAKRNAERLDDEYLSDHVALLLEDAVRGGRIRKLEKS